MNTKFLKISTVFMICLSIIACDSHNSSMSYGAATSAMLGVSQEHRTVWDRMASDFTFKDHQANPRVQKFIKQYTREDSYYLIKFSNQASPYLYHVVQLLEERGMPPELALLPIIESEYMPSARSNKGAVGIWQLTSMTGRWLGLRQDQWYDGRKDVDAATKVALDHLQYLYESFDNDWLLALAAYNCGGGRVASAIRANKKLGKPTDYWSLKLPQESMYFVPKFLSLVHLVRNHRSLEINLASIPNKPYFSAVKMTKQMNLQKVATLAEVDIKEVKRLNPGYRTQVTHPNWPHQILLPVSNVHRFQNNLATETAQAKAKAAKAKASASANTQTTSKPKAPVAATKTNKPKAIATTAKSTIHTVNRGDTLYLIATKYSTTVKAIMHKNNLTSDIIRSGQRLAI